MPVSKWAAIGVLVAIAAFALLLLIAALPVVGSLLTRPYFGWSLQSNTRGAVVVTAVEPRSSAAAAGLRPGDQLVRVGEITPNAALSERAARVFDLDLINSYDGGDTLSFASVRNGLTATRNVELAHVPTPLVSTHILLYLAFWLIAALLLWTRHSDPLVQLLAFTILALTAGNFFRPITDLPLNTTRGMLLQQICALGRFLGPALVVHFGTVFPRPTLSARAGRRIRAIAYGVTCALFLIEEYVLLRGALSSNAPYLIYDGVLATIRYWDIRFFVFLGSFITCGALLLRGYRKLSPGRERNQVKWILWSVSFAAVADTLVIAIALYAGGRYSDYLLSPYRNLLYFTIAAGLLIAILRHDLFDVDHLIRKSILYSGTTALLFLLFTGCENLVSDVLADRMPVGSSRWGTIIAAVVAAALITPVRKGLDYLLDKLIGPKRIASTKAKTPA